MPLKKTILLLLGVVVAFTACQPELIKKGPKYNYDNMDDDTIDLHKKIEQYLFLISSTQYPVKLHPATRISDLEFDQRNKKIRVHFSKLFSYVPFREDNVSQLYEEFRKTIGSDHDDYTVEIFTLDEPIENLIPNYYRIKTAADSSRLNPQNLKRPKPVVRRLDSAPINQGLYETNVALWHSHGWYYNQDQQRWMWQRARLYGTVEDLFPMSYTIPYLIPMLENAGANVFVPRERDVQINEVIVDNDSLTISPNMTSYAENRVISKIKWRSGDTPGFAIGHPPYPVNFNPFNKGTFRYIESDTVETANIEWTPALPDSGFYAVYVSYHSSAANVHDAFYTVYHSGGKSSFLVNQQIGGGTWIYLGTFKFNKGYNPQSGKVLLTNKSEAPGLTVSADAVKFGGGVGNVLREEQTSQRPKFVEGARYYLQTAGFPDTLVYSLNDNKSDYRDDYQSRGEYVNYLMGAPAGPNKNRDAEGMGIPIDVSLAFHTDAGRTENDTVIGTLQIYSILDADTQTVFPNGVSRVANRDLSDLMQTQLVDDIRTLFDPAWTRRFLREAQYSEAFRPNTPATLLELLSHHNFTDMKFGLDPRFRFHVARAIYKAIVRFTATQNQRDYTIQPLPVKHFSAQFDSSGNIRLNWQPVTDLLEPAAIAQNYKVYIRIDDGGFDNGILTSETSYVVKNPDKGKIYSFKVAALNAGGESFPSEILAVCRQDNAQTPVLIVNGFDRVAPPAIMEDTRFSGFAYFEDNGVPDRYDISFVGEQFNYTTADNWRTDDMPGHGASYATYETEVIAGNTFDFPLVHGTAIRDAGYSFASCSDESIMDGLVDLNDYKIIDLILGEEKETGWQRPLLDSLKGKEFKTFPGKMKRALRSFFSAGGGLFVSGAYIGTDLFKDKERPYPDITFAQQELHYRWSAGHAAKTGDVFAVKNSLLKLPAQFAFNTNFDRHIYRVEAPDAIRPVYGAETIVRYRENSFSAGTAFSGDYKVVAFGFPFETIKTASAKSRVMKALLGFLGQ